MKKRWKDRQQDFFMGLLRPLVYLWMRSDAKRKVLKDPKVDFKRKEPFVMLANHTFMFDVIHVPLRFKKVPFIVANQTLFKKKATKFLVTQVAHVISKQKGQSDTATVRDLIGAVKRGYPILIFPEGDTTFYGETNYIEPSTMKLIKKLGLDVITCQVRGGYLSKPRWATSKRSKRQIELHYELTISKDDIKDMTVEDVTQKITNRLYYNAYEDQRQKMIPHPSKELTHGLENVLYVCPNCQSFHTLETKGNHITCTSCQTKGTMDVYGFIQGFRFDNLIDWNIYQKTLKKELRASTFSSTARLNLIDEDNQKLTELGQITMTYKDEKFIIEGDYEMTMSIHDISNPTITFRRDFGFVYQDEHYLMMLDRYTAAFLRVAQDKY